MGLNGVICLLVVFAVGTAAPDGAGALSGWPVRVDFYGEALCPYCAKFVAEQLKPAFANGISDLFRLSYIPWGNARPGADPEVDPPQCQHGPRECDLNRLLACAIELYPLQARWFPYLACVEDAALGEGQNATSSEINDACAPKAGMVASRVAECHAGELGDFVVERAAQRTDDLRPPHRYVPWVVVNGVPLGDGFEFVIEVICAAYEGVKPAACFRAAPQAHGHGHPAALACPAVALGAGSGGAVEAA